MSMNDKFEEIVRNDLEVRAADRTYERMHRIVLAAHGSTQTNRTSTSVRRFVMSRSAMKLAVAAAVVAAVIFGLFEFLSPAGSSGVAWAEVARRVEASSGFTSRMRQRQTVEGMSQPVEITMMTYNSPYGLRLESFQGDELTGVTCADYKSGTLVSLLHNVKRYTLQTLPPNTVPDGGSAMNPRSIVADFLSGDYEELGRRTIEGVEAEGIEVTKVPNTMANFPIDSEVAQLWVSVETGYPILMECTTVGNGGKVKIEMVVDQFQWDVQFDPEEFKTEIPSDYQPLEIRETEAGTVMEGTF